MIFCNLWRPVLSFVAYTVGSVVIVIVIFCMKFSKLNSPSISASVDPIRVPYVVLTNTPSPLTVKHVLNTHKIVICWDHIIVNDTDTAGSMFYNEQLFDTDDNN